MNLSSEQIKEIVENVLTRVFAELSATTENYNITKANVSMTDEERATRELIKLGIPPHIKGYHYLRTGILICDSKKQMTKNIYPEIAKLHDTTPSKVERSMRHAIAFSKDQFKGEKLTNGRFISFVADKIRLDKIRSNN